MDLQEFFTRHPKVALGFSGGVDSSYLLYAGRHYGADIKPYFIKGAFQPEFERQDAVRLAELVGADNLTILSADILQVPQVVENPANRCYYCKQVVFGLLQQQARADGYHVLIDGTNASDDIADRPGFKALQEMQVLSPLREAGLTKAMIRQLSKEAGLFTWDKPSYACLATRVPTGTRLTAEVLQKVEQAEGTLMEMGYRDFRVRVLGEAAKLQLQEEQWPKLCQERQQVLSILKAYFSEAYLDLTIRG